MERRSFLAVGIAGIGLLAGCPSQPESPTETPTRTVTPESAAFDIEASLPDGPITVGEELVVTVRVNNPGEVAGTLELGLALDGDTVTTALIEVPAGETVTTELSATVPRSDSLAVTVNGTVVGEVAVTPPEVWYVATDGDDTGPGTEEAPLETIQEGLDRVRPGQTVRLKSDVHTAGGADEPVGITRRGGEPDDPITITGPEDAIVRGPPAELSRQPLFHINHSHVHLVGLTLDGLTKPEKDGDHRWYRPGLVSCTPPRWQDSYPDYLTDVTIKPHAIGNARAAMISHARVNDMEIGEFELVGPAGVQHLYGDAGGHVGEVVSLGVSSDNIDSSWYPWDGPDRSHDIHVHHIANLAGYSHTELVEVHQGMYDVTIEYCTDAGGSGKYRLHEEKPPSDEAAVALRGAHSTLRWCVISDGDGAGVHVGNSGLENREQFETLPDDHFPGTNNSIYGNRILDIEGLAVAFQSIRHDADFENGPGAQDVICGNEIRGETMGDPERNCSDKVPDADGRGHTGGDSPWG